MTILGIDPGQSGGIAVFNGSPQDYSAHVMPTKGARFDRIGFHDLLTKLGPDVVYVEEVQHRGGLGAKQNKTRYGDHASLVTILELLGVRYELVEAQTWQSQVIGNIKKGQSKEASIAYAERFFPNVELVVAKSKKHDGLADALCIAFYGWCREKGL